MISKKKLSGVVLAIGAASLFALTPAISTAASSHMVHCSGVNACKGKSSCKSSSNACKGQNTCKGTGFVAMSKSQCEQVGGKIE
jgi:hypothetical protein